MEYISYNLLKDSNLFNSRKTPYYIALGYFDGVHLGHQAILKLCVEKAKEDNVTSSVILLEPHPEIILNKAGNFSLLTTLEERVRHIKKLGIEKVYVLNFSEKVKKISAENFIKEILLNKLHMGAVFVGYDYHFGYQKKGDPDLIKSLADKYNFKFFILEPIKTDDGSIISSTIIKKLLEEGEIERANQLLGYCYNISGEVIHGYKRGKNILSFPTANIKIIPEKLLPKNGVYIALIKVEGKKQQGLVNIGLRPTFQDGKVHMKTDLSVEAHIFNYGIDIYSKNITIFLLKRIRDEIKFNDTESLTQQIRKDGLTADIFFKEHNKSFLKLNINKI